MLKKEQEIDDVLKDKQGLLQQIEDLKKEVNDNTKESLQIMDIKLKYEGELEKRDTWINSYSADIIKLKEEMRLKDQAIQALSETLIDKGDENQRLLEMVSQFKNHLLTSSFYNQKYYAQKITNGKEEDVTL